MTEGTSLSSINRPVINMENTNVGNNPNDKNSGEEYFDRRQQGQNQEEFQQTPFVDRAAQLRATLNSLAAINAANVVQKKNLNKHKSSSVEQNEDDEENKNIEKAMTNPIKPVDEEYDEEQEG